ncbi:MAG: NAD(P)H-dependent oxidoreductase subunit E [Acidobacteriota bacterium]
MSEEFAFTPENQARFEELLKKYPNKRAAMLPALHLVLEQHGHIPPAAEEYVAGLLEVPLVDVREVVSFYSLFIQQPHGKHHIKVCCSLSCWLRGSDRVREFLRDKLGVPEGGITDDGQISWEAVPDCLGACEMAPMAQVDGRFEADLTEEKLEELLAALREDRYPALTETE